MHNGSILKTGLVGYVYRGLRDGGLLAIAAGAWLIGSTFHSAMQNGRAGATVTGIEIECAFNSDLADVETVTGSAPNCSIPQLVKSGLVGEATFAKLAFTSETGESYRSAIRLDDLTQPRVQRGDIVQIAYSRDNPAKVRAVPGIADYIRGFGFIVGGLLMLIPVWAARRAVTFENDVAAEIAELEKAHQTLAASAGVAPRRRTALSRSPRPDFGTSVRRHPIS